MSTDALNPVCAGRLNVTKPSPRPPYTHFGKVFELIDRRFAVHRPTQKCLVGPNQNLLRARTGSRTGNGPCREHDGGMEERRRGDGDISSVPGA